MYSQGDQLLVLAADLRLRLFLVGLVETVDAEPLPLRARARVRGLQGQDGLGGDVQVLGHDAGGESTWWPVIMTAWLDVLSCMTVSSDCREPVRAKTVSRNERN